jgi:peptide-methionine (S)-S-oxide reductase
VQLAISKNFLTIIYIMVFFCSCAQKEKNKAIKTDFTMNDNMQLATFGAGCFWCVEAVFQNLEGVIKVESGYSGGKIKNPAYREVCNGTTGHAEVCQITYDSSKITFDELLGVFWKTHDPTTLNYQGNDHGTQYRSVVFYHNEIQKEKALYYMKKLTEEKVFEDPIVTEISPYAEFYKAEDYHQNYYNDNKDQPYCRFVIAPKVEKFKKVFKDKMKK